MINMFKIDQNWVCRCALFSDKPISLCLLCKTWPQGHNIGASIQDLPTAQCLTPSHAKKPQKKHLGFVQKFLAKLNII